MPNYRRAYQPGGTYFFTLVTYHRRKLFAHEENRKLLSQTIRKVQTRYPFDINAWVLLPDHMHCIWSLPENDADFSIRWNLIKSQFSKKIQEDHRSRVLKFDERRNNSGIWQNRFWEHLIRDEDDFQLHMHYIHYNPVKHGWVAMVKDWPYSTFHRYVKAGIYPENWGGNAGGDDLNVE